VGKKPAEGMTFTLMMGALSPDPFWVVVARGAEDAQNQLGAKVEINWGKHDVDYDITKIEEAIARKVDGIGMNFWKIEAFKDAVQKALNTGINFIGFNSDDPTTGRLWYIGQDLVIAGEVLGKYVLNKWGLKKGDVVAWAQMFPSATYSIKRTEGLKRVFDPAGVKLVGIETTWEIPEMISRMTAWLQANPKPVGILFDGGQILMGSEELLKPLGYKAGDIPCGGFDLNPKVGELIQNGWVDVTIDQQPYLQGYLTVYSLYLAKFGNFVLPDINTGSYVVDKSNIDKVMKGIELGIR
jgi:simple sugar transport system substrate-binding protein